MSLRLPGAVTVGASGPLPLTGGPVFLVYSPSVHAGVTFSGGWRRWSDIGPDRLYASPAGENHPQEIAWTDGAPYARWHLNDPSVVTAPAAGEALLMYVTALSTAWSGPGATLEDIVSHNLTGLATSADGGASWRWEGVVIGQDNGLDGTGAWSPSAVATGDAVHLWYHTSPWDRVSGDPAVIAPRALHSVMDASGRQLLRTEEALRADTGEALHLINLDVEQAADGSFWMVGQDLWRMDAILAFRSDDGLHWSPWSGAGPDLLTTLPDGSLARTPDIVAIAEDGMGLTLMLSTHDGADIFDPAILFDPARAEGSFAQMQEVTVRLEDAFLVKAAGAEWAGERGQDARGGPVASLDRQFFHGGPDSVVVLANMGNVFIKGGEGDDALQAIGGANVLDGGPGSNWLVGERTPFGSDTFFLDARGGRTTWSTVQGADAGDALTIWGLTPGGRWRWEADAGAPGYTGATLRVDADEDGFSEASLTLAGMGLPEAKALAMSWGSIEGNAYLHILI